jgi:hypothetical protein
LLTSLAAGVVAAAMAERRTLAVRLQAQQMVALLLQHPSRRLGLVQALADFGEPEYDFVREQERRDQAVASSHRVALQIVRHSDLYTPVEF